MAYVGLKFDLGCALAPVQGALKCLGYVGDWVPRVNSMFCMREVNFILCEWHRWQRPRPQHKMRSNVCKMPCSFGTPSAILTRAATCLSFCTNMNHVV